MIFAPMTGKAYGSAIAKDGGKESNSEQVDFNCSIGMNEMKSPADDIDMVTVSVAYAGYVVEGALRTPVLIDQDWNLVNYVGKQR